jgi:hypothetical protein
VRVLLELIVAWGINPSLQAGVGIPLARRSKRIKVGNHLNAKFKPTFEALT